MKKLSTLAALAFALAVSTANSHACDFGMHAANATPVVVVCDGNGCAAAPTTQQAAANPEAATPPAAHRGDQFRSLLRLPTVLAAAEPVQAGPAPNSLEPAARVAGAATSIAISTWRGSLRA